MCIHGSPIEGGNLGLGACSLGRDYVAGKEPGELSLRAFRFSEPVKTSLSPPYIDGPREGFGAGAALSP